MRGQWFCIVIIGMLLSISITSMLAQDSEAVSPAIVILDVEGKIDYIRPTWIGTQPLLFGTLLNTQDFIFPNNASLVVMCPDGRAQRFVATELLPNDILSCNVNPADYIIGNPGMRRLAIQRGGRQDSTIPYLIAPRATVVRTPQVELVWNHLSDAVSYTVTVRENTAIIWTSGELASTNIVADDIARIMLPLALNIDIPYTVEICVLLNNTERGCTTDAGWAAGVDVAFYYHPNSLIDQRIADLIADIGDNTPASLYARAVLLTQPVAELSTPDQPIAYYNEAIVLLEQLIADFPDSSLATSPELYNQLGELYRSINLPQSAATAFDRAVELAQRNTESYALAAHGQAITTRSQNPAALYNVAVDAYSAFLTKDAFLDVFGGLCRAIGETCLDLSYCQADQDFCIAQLLDD